MNMSVEEQLRSQVDQLQKQLTHAGIKIELISRFLKSKFVDANFPVKMVGAVMLKRVKLNGLKIRARNKLPGKSTGTVEKRLKLRKSTSATNVGEFDNSSTLHLAMKDESQRGTGAELFDETRKSGNGDPSNEQSNTPVAANSRNEGMKLESSLIVQHAQHSGEVSKKCHKSKNQQAGAKTSDSVRLERMKTSRKDCSLSKRRADKKNKTGSPQQASSVSKVRGKRFKCNWTDCSKQFTSRTEIERHWRVHTGVKPFKCPWPHCKSRFNHRSSLTRHKRIHTGEKVYFCQLCGEQFLHRNTFISHLRRHTGEKPYKCDVCADEFRCCCSLRKHKKRRHLLV